MYGQARRAAFLVALTYRGSLTGGRLWISALLAALAPVLLGAVVAYGDTGTTVLSGWGTVLTTLVLSVQLPLTALIIGVGLFRTEIDEDTLPYLTLRTLARPWLVVGKYLGGWLAVLTFLLPSFAISLGITAYAADGVGFPSGYGLAGLALVVLGSLVYLAIYLVIGLVTPSAVVVGLVYAFLWEFVLPLFPGHLPQVTVYYYLRALAASITSAGALGSYPNAVGLGGALAVLLGVALAALVLAGVVVGYVETAPGRSET
jgi:ABC-2 type transport system permease protein